MQPQNIVCSLSHQHCCLGVAGHCVQQLLWAWSHQLSCVARASSDATASSQPPATSDMPTAAHRLALPCHFLLPAAAGKLNDVPSSWGSGMAAAAGAHEGRDMQDERQMTWKWMSCAPAHHVSQQTGTWWLWWGRELHSEGVCTGKGGGGGRHRGGRWCEPGGSCFV
jgi:hypothetical protein